MNDPIVEEIRKNRDNILKANNYDLEKLAHSQYEKIEKLKQSGWKVVSKKDVLESKKSGSLFSTLER